MLRRLQDKFLGLIKRQKLCDVIDVRVPCQNAHKEKLELWEKTKEDIRELTKEVITDANKHIPTHLVLKDGKIILAFKLDKLALNGYSYFRRRFSREIISLVFDKMKKMIEDRGLDAFVYSKGSKKAVFDDDFLFDTSFGLSSLIYHNPEGSFIVKDCDIILEITDENKEEVKKLLKSQEKERLEKERYGNKQR